MGKLHTWAVTIAAVVVGLSPGLAILSARPIARLIRGTLWPWPVDNRARSVCTSRRSLGGLVMVTMTPWGVKVAGRYAIGADTTSL